VLVCTADGQGNVYVNTQIRDNPTPPALLQSTTGTTASGFVTALTITGANGMSGMLTIKNTGGANGLTWQVTVTDMFGGNNVTATGNVAFGASQIFDLSSSLAGGTLPPYTSVAIATKDQVSSNHTTFTIKGTLLH
jgi:hypothetical protein